MDDIIVTGSHLARIEALKHHLDVTFSIKDLGLLNYFLGLEISYLSTGIVISQGKFTKELLNLVSEDLSKPAVTPLPLNIKLNGTDGDVFHSPELYRSLVGKLNYLTNTRPDLAFTVQMLSQFIHLPREPHYQALLHTL